MAKNSIIPIFIPHAGCPHACVFCNQRSISGHAAPPDAHEIAQTVENALEKIRPGAELAFYGGSFTAIPASLQEEYLGAAAPFIKDGSISAIRVSTRPDAVDSEILTRLERFGVKTVELGAQSMDDAVLKKSARGHTAADTRAASRLIKSRGFRLVLQMMVGLPGDTPEKDEQTARQLCALAPDAVRIYPAVVLKGTALCELWKRGEYEPLSVENAARICAGLLRIFDGAAVPVIRLGLNPSEELSGGEAVAGAYHPALGELARSRLFYENAAAALSGEQTAGKSVEITVHTSRVGTMAGHKRGNITLLRERFSLKNIRITASPSLPENTLSCKFLPD